MADAPLTAALRDKRAQVAATLERLSMGDSLGLEPVAVAAATERVEHLLAQLDALIARGESAANA
jgi:hypothetical protein